MPGKLTDTAIRGAKPREKAYKLTDGGGLCLEVAPIATPLPRVLIPFLYRSRSSRQT